MILLMIDSSANGLYSVAQKIPSIITMFTSIFIQAWQLSAMKTFGESDFDSFFSGMFRLLSLVMIVGCCVILVFNKEIASILFQKEFYEAWKYVPMLTLASLLSNIAGFLASAFTSSKKTNVLFVSTSVGAIVNFVINYILILCLKTLGAAIATVISFSVVVFIRIITLKGIVKLTGSYWKIIVSFIVLFIAAFSTPWVSHYKIMMMIISAIILFMIHSELIDGLRNAIKIIFGREQVL